MALGVIGASVRCKQIGREAKSTILHTLRTGFEVNADSSHAERLLLCLLEHLQSIGTLAPKRHVSEETMADRCEKGKFDANRQQQVCKIHFLESDYHVSDYVQEGMSNFCLRFSVFDPCLNSGVFDTVCTLYSVPELGLHHLSA